MPFRPTTEEVTVVVGEPPLHVCGQEHQPGERVVGSKRRLEPVATTREKEMQL